MNERQVRVLMPSANHGNHRHHCLKYQKALQSCMKCVHSQQCYLKCLNKGARPMAVSARLPGTTVLLLITTCPAHDPVPAT